MDFHFNIKRIQEVIDTIPFVVNLINIHQNDVTIDGSFEVYFEGLDENLLFRFEISPQYPLKHQDSESIKFYTEKLIELNHVMENGSICIHNNHCTNLEQKLLYDFTSLQQWILKYYINREHDDNYEHVIVDKFTLDDEYKSFLFTQVDHRFHKNDFGFVTYSSLNTSAYNGKFIHNYLVQNFAMDDQVVNCKWNNFYTDDHADQIGIFYFLDSHPARYNKFIFKNWLDFKNLLSDDFLNYLHEFDKKYHKKDKNQFLPIFIGYNTKNNEIYWQVALLELEKLPLKGVKENIFGNIKWKSKLVDQEIKWAFTRDSSYQYFFGRGTFTKNITEKKILIVGVGAIGSMVAKTLTRSGCKQINIIDYDIKEPENVCRSEYMFQFGLGDKVEELPMILNAISPFVEISILKKEYLESITKIFYKDHEARKHLLENLNEYDIIFDCSTDNDLMKIFDDLKCDLKGNIINLSITNHAKELVCGFSPNIYNYVLHQYQKVLDHDISDLYNPLGCWSPTFKASYNDIDLLVQYALKHINTLYRDNKPMNNFVIQENQDNLSLEIKEY